VWQRIVRRWSLAESGAAHIRPPVAAGQHWIRGALARPNNLRYASVLPAGIVRCKSTTDAAQAILWSREFNVPLIARSGGHSYAGYSTTTGLMLDLSLMNRTSFDPSTGIVTVGGGVVNRDLYRALKEANVTITHGRCPSVGGAAFVLGGGVGFNMRRYGLACDQMLKTTLVDADGNVLTATPGENADLFWACRGAGGGNLGINTSLSLQTFPVQDLTVFRLAWNSNPEDLYAALVDALAAAPATLGSRLALDAVTRRQLAAGRDVRIRLLGQLAGTPAGLAEILEPAYRVAEPSSADIRVMSYWDAQINFLAEPGPPDRYQEKSAFFVGPITSAAVGTAFDWARRWPGTSEAAHMVLFQTGDQVDKVAPDATAFVHRNSHWLMTIALSWGSADSSETVGLNLEWQGGFYESMRAFTTGAYVNFPDPSLTTWEQDYYGANLAHLQRIKAAVDPAQVFRFPQSIRPVASAAAEAGSGNAGSAYKDYGLLTRHTADLGVSHQGVSAAGW